MFDCYDRDVLRKAGRSMDRILNKRKKTKEPTVQERMGWYYDKLVRDALIDGAEQMGMALDAKITGGKMKLTNEQAAEVDMAVTGRADAIIRGKREKYSGFDDPYKNFRDAAYMAEEETWQSVISRTTDKFSRIKNMIKQGMTEEGWNDLMLNDFPDIVNYARILAGLCKEEWLNRAPPPASYPRIISIDGEHIPSDGEEYEGGGQYDTETNEGWDTIGGGRVPYAGGSGDWDQSQRKPFDGSGVS